MRWLSLVGCVLAVAPAAAQGRPGTNLSVAVNAVSVIRTSDTTRVSYVATNNAASREQMWALTVEAPSEPLAITVPGARQDWHTASVYGNRPVVRWVVLGNNIIPPGARSPELSFSALGLPAIVDARIEGYYDPPRVEELGDDDPYLTGDPLETNAVPIRVVGVQPTPSGTTTPALTARLDSLTAEACSLKWITDPIICTTLRTLLVAQPPGLLAFKTGLVAGRKTGKVTDNAFWLLSVNADYIIARGLTLRAGEARRAQAHTDLR